MWPRLTGAVVMVSVLLSWPRARATPLSLQAFLQASERQSAEAERLATLGNRTVFPASLKQAGPRRELTARSETSLDGTGASLGVLSQLPNTGSELSVTWEKRTSPPHGDICLNVSQSLLRNRWGQTYDFWDQVAHAQAELARVEANLALENLRSSWATAYLQWQAQHLGCADEQHHLRTLEQLSLDLKRRLTYGAATPLQAQQLEYRTLRRREQASQCTGETRRHRAKIAALAGADPLTTEPDASPPFSQPNWERDLELFWAESPTLRLVRLREEIATQQLRSNELQEGPELTANLGVKYSQATSQATPFAGIQLQLPLQDTLQQRRRWQDAAELTQQQLSGKNILQERRIALAQLKESIIAQGELTTLRRSRWSLAKKIAEQSHKKFTTVELPLEAVLSAEDDEATSRSEMLAAQLGLQQLIVRWYQLTDQLSAQLPVSLPTGSQQGRSQ